MTRLLAPEMFGLMAIATTLMTGLAMFSDLGLKPNIIQSNRGTDPAFLNTAWATQVLRGLLLWLGGLIVGLLIYGANLQGFVPANSVYANFRLPFVIAALSATAVVSGFESTKVVEASRNLLLSKITQIDIAAQFCALACMIGWASIGRSIWALVAGGICSSVVRTALTHVWLPGVPNRWEWDTEAFLEIFRFGKWMFVSSILGFLVNSGDRLLLGGWLSATDLGVYMIAYLIFSSFEQILTKLMGDISLPALSELARDRPTSLKRGYYRIHIFLATFAYLFAGILMTGGDSLINFLYDRRYSEAGWMLEILALILISIPFRLATQSYLALGQPRLLSNTIAIRLVALFIAAPIGFYAFGISGAIWGIALSHFSYLPAIMLYNIRHGIFNILIELSLLPIVILGAVIGILISVIIER